MRDRGLLLTLALLLLTSMNLMWHSGDLETHIMLMTMDGANGG